MKNFKYTFLSLVLILIFNVLPLKAEILFRGGFLGQNLSTSEVCFFDCLTPRMGYLFFCSFYSLLDPCPMAPAMGPSSWLMGL